MTIVIDHDVLIPFTAAVAETTIINAGVTIAAAGPFAVQLAGNDIILRNRGTIDGPDRVGVLMAANQSFFVNDATGTLSGGYVAIEATTLNGLINNFGAMTGTFAGVDLSGAADTRVKNSGTITAQDTGVIVRDGTTGSKIINDGVIDATSSFGSAINILADSLDTRITNNGDLSGTAYGVRSNGLGTHIENAGTVTGEFGIWLTESAFVLNAASGTISGSTAALVMNNDWGSASITNFGTINGLVALDDAADQLRNAGDLNGDLRAGGGRDVVVNEGSISGNVLLGAGDDQYKGEAATASVKVSGDEGNDRIHSGAFADDLSGNDGRDTLNGGGGKDRLNGGSARDILTGGADADTFVYNDASDASSFDIIIDFNSGIDAIDLTELSSGTLAFLGTSDFVGGGQGGVRYDVTTFGHAFVRVDADGDGVHDMSILLRDGGALIADDFLL